ncbi:hypothetical protein ACYULU_10085 [Breznakiellaceae bacterium SP9]
MPTDEYVFDACALLALLDDEAGAAAVDLTARTASQSFAIASCPSRVAGNQSVLMSFSFGVVAPF